MNSLLILISLIIGSVYSDINDNLSENEKYLLNKIEVLSQHFQRNISELTQKNEELNKKVQDLSLNSNTCEKGWFAYTDQKCFKVIEEKATEEEAVSKCSSLDAQAQLVSIHSQQELDFLSNQLIKYNNISDNVWIGLKYTNKSFKWLDNTDSDYNNWSDDAIRDGSNTCVEMSIIGKLSLGKWLDESCNRKALIVCQKKQLTLTVFVKDLNNITKVIDKQNDEIISLRQISLPIGFIYTQLPNQSSPVELWPQTVWMDVTEEYSGLFFRAEGGNSGSFGETQQQNYSRISDVMIEALNGAQYSEHLSGQYSLQEGKWSVVVSGETYALNGLKLYTTTCDNRPINTAVKIWKRIQ